jgi:MGT family glycosyltransferase
MILMEKFSTIQPGTRVLMANFPADGHFNPLTGIATHLKNLGCDVRWYTSKKYEHKIQKLGIPFYGLKNAVDLGSDNDIDNLFPERKKHKGKINKLCFDMEQIFILRGPEYYKDLKEIRQGFSFDIMIADIAFTGIPFVKDIMKIPVIGVSVFPLPETSRDLPPYGLGMTPANSYLGKLKHAALRYISDKILFAKPIKALHEVMGRYGIEVGGLNIFDFCIQKSNLILQSGTPGFEYKRSDLSSHISFAGPLLPKLKQSGTEWYDQRVKEYSKVLLLTQGTIERDVTKLLLPTLEAFKDTDHLLIVTTGGSETEKLKQQYPHDNIIIEDFIPFHEVLPYADVYISNGGYGGVMLSIQNQVPMVVAGIHEGKNEINARIGYFNLGIDLKTETPSPEMIKAAVKEVLSTTSFKHNVKVLGKEFAQYDPYAITERLVTGLVKLSAKRRISASVERTF